MHLGMEKLKKRILIHPVHFNWNFFLYTLQNMFIVMFFEHGIVNDFSFPYDGKFSLLGQ
jgi:hypothetical protein